MKTQVTRKSMLGFGYTSACENDCNGNLKVREVERPDHVGTIKKVAEAMENDKYLQSLHGGTYYNTDWFVKLAGQWHKINWDYPTVFDLLVKIDGKYWIDVLDVDLID